MPLIRSVASPLSSQTPSHVAIIMDGNGRWAKARGLARFEGHRRGLEAVRRVVRSAIEHGVRYLTVYSFSSENSAPPAGRSSDADGPVEAVHPQRSRRAS